ncbi:MAG TPA: nuclease-related domain-containing protein [Chthoniobacteraceae bacterium]|nr:nuclease-related domain-containing protein [Chthoniobacteraceae bacterium]
MAKIIGESGRSIEKPLLHAFRRMFFISLAGIGLMALVVGYVLCLALHDRLIPLWLAGVELGFLAGAGCWIGAWVMRGVDRNEHERARLRKGALGEATVGLILEGLPDCFTVFNDPSRRRGNIDHIVVGPTGIFVIDTKNWRGAVTPDGLGELLCNGKTTGRCEVATLLRAIASLRAKINVLTHRDDFIQGIIAFPLARVEARWGATRNVHCLTDDRILDYITHYNFSRRLKHEEIELIEKAFNAIAGMGKGLDPAEGGLTVLPASKP